MDIFYRKFYADETPFWLHLLIVLGINLRWRWTQLKYNLLDTIKTDFNLKDNLSAKM